MNKRCICVDILAPVYISNNKGNGKPIYYCDSYEKTVYQISAGIALKQDIIIIFVSTNLQDNKTAIDIVNYITKIDSNWINLKYKVQCKSAFAAHIIRRKMRKAGFEEL